MLLKTIRSWFGTNDWLLHPLFAMINTYSITGLLIIQGLIGRYEEATHIAIAHSAFAMTFYVLSGDARGLILSNKTNDYGNQTIQFRLVSVVPASIFALIICKMTFSSFEMVVLILTIRRALDWLLEALLVKREKDGESHHLRRIFAIDAFLLILGVTLQISLDIKLGISLIPWCLMPGLALVILKLRFSFQKKIDYAITLPHIASTTVIGFSVLAFRSLIIHYTTTDKAGLLFTAYAIGSTVPTLIGQVIAPTLLNRIEATEVKRSLRNIIGMISLVFFAIGCIYLIGSYEELHSDYFLIAVSLSILGGGVMTGAVIDRSTLVHKHPGETFIPDLMSNALLLTAIPSIFYLLGGEYFSILYLLSAILNFIMMKVFLSRLENHPSKV